MFTADAADCAQLLRHLGEHRGAAPNWRRHRPALLVEAAEFRPDGGSADGGAATAAEGAPGTLLLRCANEHLLTHWIVEALKSWPALPRDFEV